MARGSFKYRTDRLLDLGIVPMECLSIPYTLTDFGRAYLAVLRARESVAAREWLVRRDNALRRRQQAEHHSR